MSNTLIIPCAGKSSRFPDMRPKWMLTHPDGQLMVEKAISGFDLSIFDRIIITIVKQHDIDYEAALVLGQLFGHNSKFELCILDDHTSSQSETVLLTLEKMKVNGSFVVKDSDNYVKVIFDQNYKNFVVGLDLKENPDIQNVAGKSFIIANEQDIMINIIEKTIKSDLICVGVYGFESPEMFKKVYMEMINNDLKELFLSHLISYMINNNTLYKYIKATSYRDWGTFQEWLTERSKHRCYLVDIDGVLMKNCGKFGSFNWDVNDITLDENLKVIKKAQDEGGQIILISSRPDKYIKKAIVYFEKFGIQVHGFVGNCNHGQRVLINDFSNTNPYPTAKCINMKRNGQLDQFFKGE